MIPKIIHQVWLGDEPLPMGAMDWMAAWHQQHPDWEYHLWRSPPFTLVNQYEFDTAKHLAQQADILRYELLFHFGGIYADVDVECLKSFEPLLNTTAFAGYERPEDNYLCNAVIGAEVGSLFMRHLITQMPRFWNRGLNFFFESSPIYFSLIAEANSDLVVRHPEHYFYPYRYHESERRRERFPDSYAVHHWLQSWNPESSASSPTPYVGMQSDNQVCPESRNRSGA